MFAEFTADGHYTVGFAVEEAFRCGEWSVTIQPSRDYPWESVPCGVVVHEGDDLRKALGSLAGYGVVETGKWGRFYFAPCD